MRLDHLLSKEEKVGVIMLSIGQGKPRLNLILAGGDALMGHTRSHPEHDG